MKDSNSFSFYLKIYPYRPNWITWFFIGGFGFMLLIYNLPEQKFWTNIIGFLLIGIAILRYLIQFLHAIISFKKFKNFNKNLGFELIGWEIVSENCKIMTPQYWSLNCSLEIATKNNSDNVKYITDALFLFCQDANQRYYRTLHGSGRKEWKLKGELSAEGSIDLAVSGDIYNFLEFYLKPIHSKFDCIKSVNINWDDRITYVKLTRGPR